MLDAGARACADIAYMRAPGSTADKVGAAITVYLWAAWHGEQFGFYPSLIEITGYMEGESYGAPLPPPAA